MSTHDNWSSRLGFILAAAGSAIGLGAIWKFPYTAGTHGGAVFFLLFILFTFLVAAPILVAEFVIGRHSRHNAIQAFHRIRPRSLWPGVGWLGVVTCFVLLSFYSVVGGWVIAYIYHGLFGHLQMSTNYGEFFSKMISNPAEALIFQGIFMLATVYVVQAGVSQGIERANKYMMPALFIMFILLAVRSLTLDGAWQGVVFLLKPDWSFFNGKTMLAALGQAFFALSIGVSVMITYASYLRDDYDLLRSANSIVWMNLAISLLAGLVIFPAVYALGFSPAQGPGLIFSILPAVFAKLPFGIPLFVIFMVLVLFATLTSAFSMLENIVAVMVYKKPEKRSRYTWGMGTAIFIAGIPSALSFSSLKDVKFLGELNIFDSLDLLVTGWSMPIGALLIAIFTVWIWQKDAVRREVMTGSNLSEVFFRLWYILVRFIAPLAIVVVFLNGLGVFS
ncbi:MAG: sodium-dependent transporter [Cardiobacteriaceae bacterium]|nr:sodium-dependent transporter [Cardiobacteriaceae bacterium]